MRAAALRTVLLIQAIEESDTAGELLPLPDRTEATREALKDAGELKHAFAGGRLSRSAERVIAARAASLRGKISIRSPVIDQILDPAHAPPWIAQALFVLAIASGLLLSMLDGMGRINILAWPLVVLLIWNLAVYVRAIVASKRSSPGSALYSAMIQRHARKLIAQSARFHAPLTDALHRFASDWGRVAAPVIAQHGRRLLHVAALCVAVGLVGGWCLRAFVFRDDAGWDSSFLGPKIVLWFVHLLFGPAAALLGTSLPSSAPEIEQLRWSATNPARGTFIWVHLLAATTAIYIVVPRLIALLASSAKRWNLSRSLCPPRTLLPYARGVLLNVSELGSGVAGVTPYAYSPDHHTMEGLENVLSAVLGGTVLIDAREPITYGAPLQDPPAAADWIVILCTLASTPDASAQGALFVACRDRLLEGRSSAPLLIAIDESPIAGGPGSNEILAAKIVERRKLWTDFVAEYGLPVCMMPFGRYRRGAVIDNDVREAVQAAFWTPTRT